MVWPVPVLPAASQPVSVVTSPTSSSKSAPSGSSVTTEGSAPGWTPGSGARHPTAWARALMREIEQNPNSSLNVKLRAAGIDRPARAFADSVGVIADPQKLGAVPPEALQRAIRGVVEFAADQYVAAGGRPSPFFKTIELVPERAEGLRDAVLRDDHLSMGPGGALRVEIPTARLSGQTKPLGPEQLQAQWDSGRQFTDDRARRAWPLLNPTGELRSTLRATAQDAAARLTEELGAFQSKPSAGSRRAHDAFKALANRYVGPEAKASDGTPMRAAIAERVDGASDAQLASWAADWQQRVGDAGFRDEVLGQVVDVAREDQPNLKSEAIGLVAVANAHQIDVVADATVGASSVRRFVSRPESSRSTHVRAVGLIAVATQDTVNVRATLSALQGPASAAIAGEALARTFGL